MDEHALMFDNHCVVHWMHFLSTIKPSFVGFIIPQFSIFDKFLSIILMQPWNSCISLFNKQPLNIMTNGMINAWCYDNNITTNCWFCLIPWRHLTWMCCHALNKIWNLSNIVHNFLERKKQQMEQMWTVTSS
jgi:hypothetical protein